MDSILHEARQYHVRGILANAARLEEWATVIRLARQEPVYGALGLHPFFLDAWTPAVPEQLRQALTTGDRLRAVGEIGLDFQQGRENAESQIEAFRAQLSIARELALPVILHNRKSWSEFFGVLREMGLDEIRGVCHHFSGSIEIARQALDKGLYLSFCGPVTYPNARRLHNVAAYVPLDRLLTETDTPDLPSQAHRGDFSMPHHVADVVMAIAAIKDLPAAAVAEQVERNFRAVLGLSPEEPTAGPVLPITASDCGF